MKDELFNIPMNKPRILVAPLDWGLGHTTRCIPIISKLLQQNCEVIVAAESAGKILLQKEFPNLHFLELKGYRMRYSKNKFWLPVILLLQFPKLIYRIYAENSWLKKIVEELKIDAVISDNRLGLSHKKISCVYITHQLQIKTGNRFTERIAQKIHYHFINKYTTCWVPDMAGADNLAGSLSHPALLPKTPVVYLGPLSRFEKKDLGIKYGLCILLSGPEPQRTAFENIALSELKKFSGKTILIRGLPGKTLGIELNNPDIDIKNHLTATELNEVLLQSELIICRSGYTTIMDLVKLQKKALLVPTPGQTEQEYLGLYLQKRQLFPCLGQKHFSFTDVLAITDSFPYYISGISQTEYRNVIEDFVNSLVKK